MLVLPSRERCQWCQFSGTSLPVRVGCETTTCPSHRRFMVGCACTQRLLESLLYEYHSCAVQAYGSLCVTQINQPTASLPLNLVTSRSLATVRTKYLWPPTLSSSDNEPPELECSRQLPSRLRDASNLHCFYVGQKTLNTSTCLRQLQLRLREDKISCVCATQTTSIASAQPIERICEQRIL